jgi:hypothetical protein
MDSVAGALPDQMQRNDFDIDAEARLSPYAHQVAGQE